MGFNRLNENRSNGRQSGPVGCFVFGKLIRTITGLVSVAFLFPGLQDMSSAADFDLFPPASVLDASAAPFLRLLVKELQFALGALWKAIIAEWQPDPPKTPPQNVMELLKALPFTRIIALPRGARRGSKGRSLSTLKPGVSRLNAIQVRPCKPEPELMW